MAKTIMLQNPASGVIKKGFYGFSWTTLFFGGFPALFRGDARNAIYTVAGAFLTGGLYTLIWAFFYNKSYTQKLLDEGFALVGDPVSINSAMAALGLFPTKTNHIVVNPQGAPQMGQPMPRR